MKHRLVSFIVLLAALALPTLSRAYDFSAVAPSGQTLYYNIVNGKAQVTYQTTAQSYTTYPTGDLTIPSSVTYDGTTYSVTSIGSQAFYSCGGLSSVTIPNSVTTIGDNAFAYCSGLTSVNIPNSVTTIGELAFSFCRGLNSVTIPNSVTSIEAGAFAVCSGLTSVTIPISVTTIGIDAFSYCSGLESVIIPNSVTSIGTSAFSGCSGLTSIIVDNGNSAYDSRNNCNAIIETATNTLIAGCQNTVIPNSVTSIREEAFYGCSGLTSVTIPNSLTAIEKRTFAECSGLTSVNIPNSVTVIGEGAFVECSGLTSVTIPNSVTAIGEGAFAECSCLADVTCLATTPPSLGGDAFSGIPSLCTLAVPCGSEQAYQCGDWGTYFTTIQCDEVGIGDMGDAGVRVWSAEGRIFVEGGEAVVYDMVGRMISGERRVENGEVVISVPASGAYLVRIGQAPARRIVVVR